ncbi:MAG: MFS transporter [Solirubrobacterales bacterium]
MRAALRPLSIPVFRRLAFARLVDELGDWLGEIALAVLVFDQTGSLLAVTALFLALQFVPAIATPPLVARLEAVPSRFALAGLNLAQALVFVELALLEPNFSLAPVIGLAALGGALAITARTLSRVAATAAAEPRGLLREANALLNIGFTMGVAVGPAVAGVVVAGAGPRTALFADAVSFGVVAILMATASGLPRTKVEEAGSIERLRRGIAYVRAQPQLRIMIKAQAAAFVFFALVIPIEVVFAKETLGAGDAGYGALLASWGVGMVVGGAAFALLRRIPLRVLLPISVFAIGAAYLLTGVAPSLVFACLASVLGGVGNGIEWVALVTAVQQLTRAEYQARVVSLVDSVARAAPGVGFVLGGGIAALFSPRASYAVAGAGVMIVLGLASIALTRAGWRGDSPEEDEVEQAPSEPADAEVPESPPLGGVEPAEATPRSGAA